MKLALNRFFVEFCVGSNKKCWPLIFGLKYFCGRFTQWILLLGGNRKTTNEIKYLFFWRNLLFFLFNCLSVVEVTHNNGNRIKNHFFETKLFFVLIAPTFSRGRGRWRGICWNWQNKKYEGEKNLGQSYKRNLVLKIIHQSWILCRCVPTIQIIKIV